MLISEKLVGKKHLDSFHSTTNSLAMGFLAPIFFAGIGLEFNFQSIQSYGLLFAVLFVSYFSKIMGGFLGAKFAGLSSRTSLTMGIGLNARGIMELVIANIELGIQSKEKEKKAAEFVIADIELSFQKREKERHDQRKIRKKKDPTKKPENLLVSFSFCPYFSSILSGV